MTVIDYFLKVPCCRIHFQRKNFFYEIYPQKCPLADFTHKATLLFWKANRF